MDKLNKDDVRTQALNQVVEEKRRAVSRRTSQSDHLEEKWLELYKVYRCVRDDDEQAYDGRAKIVSSDGFAAVENAVASVAQTLFPMGYRFFDLKPKAEIFKDLAKINTELIKSQMNDTDFYSKYITFIRQGCIYGTAIAKVFWKYQPERVIAKEVSEVSERGDFKSSSISKEIAYDNPEFQCVDIFDFYIDPLAISVDDAKYCIERSTKSYADLKVLEGKGIYENVEELKDLAGSQINISEYKTERIEAAGISVPTVDDDKSQIELLERWGKIPLSWITLNDSDKDTEIEGVITIANEKQVIRLQANPFWHQRKPYLAVRYTPVDHEFYGIGLLEPVKALFYEVNDTHNQVLDNRTMVLCHMWKKDRTAGINNAQLKFKPFGVIETNDINGIEPLMPIDVTGSGERMLLQLKTDFMDGTGIHKYAEGGGIRGANETATGITSIIEEGNKRLKLATKNYEKEGLERFVRLVYQMNQQFVTAERVINVMGKDGLGWFKLRPDDVVGDYEVEVLGSSYVSNKMLQLQNINQFLSVIGQDQNINRMAIYKKVWELLGFDNFEELQPQMMPMLPGMSAEQGGAGGVGGMPLEAMQANQGGQYEPVATGTV